jgi:hypothetical protein
MGSVNHAPKDSSAQSVRDSSGEEALQPATPTDAELGADAERTDDASPDAILDVYDDTPDEAADDVGRDEMSAASEGGSGSDASCTFSIDAPPLLPGTHVPIGTAIQWDSNPPSSGPHFPVWAAYQAYSSPVPRGYYVHNLEHGAIVLLYNCSSPCPEIVAALEAVSNTIPDDPLCSALDAGVRVRSLVTPDPLLDVRVAAAAWGWTYRADCVDVASLSSFAAAHYGQGPEVLCDNGTTQF